MEETNKLRAKLGLAPLEESKATVKESTSGNPNEKQVIEDGFEFTHKPAGNWADKKKTEKMREKLETQKGKRGYMEKLARTKGLGEEEEGESASAWVERSRKLEEEKKLAEKRVRAPLWSSPTPSSVMF